MPSEKKTKEKKKGNPSAAARRSQAPLPDPCKKPICQPSAAENQSAGQAIWAGLHCLLMHGDTKPPAKLERAAKQHASSTPASGQVVIETPAHPSGSLSHSRLEVHSFGSGWSMEMKTVQYKKKTTS